MKEKKKLQPVVLSEEALDYFDFIEGDGYELAINVIRDLQRAGRDVDSFFIGMKNMYLNMEIRSGLSSAKRKYYSDINYRYRDIDTAERRSVKYKAWRVSVFKRDKFTCQHCGEVGENLNAHHICSFSEYPELQTNIDNGITLCKKCHIEEHKALSKNKKND